MKERMLKVLASPLWPNNVGRRVFIRVDQGRVDNVRGVLVHHASVDHGRLRLWLHWPHLPCPPCRPEDAWVEFAANDLPAHIVYATCGLPGVE